MSMILDPEAFAARLIESGAFDKRRTEALVQAMRSALNSPASRQAELHECTMSSFDRFERNVVRKVAWIAAAATIFLVMLSRAIR